MQPCALPAVCRTLATCLGQRPEDVACATSNNSARFFRLDVHGAGEDAEWEWMPWPLRWSLTSDPLVAEATDSETIPRTNIQHQQESTEQRQRLKEALDREHALDVHTISTLTSKDSIPLGTDLDPHHWVNDWAARKMQDPTTQQLIRCNTGCRVIDAENVGYAFGREVVGNRLYYVEGVRRAIYHYREKGILVIVVSKRSETQQSIPIDVKFVKAERTDDIIILKESQRWNCPIVSRDSYDNWKD